MLKITVIIPVYNAAAHLRACLDSVVGQHFQNYEALLIDDGSTDDSGAICAEYAAKDARFIVLRHETNRGTAAARNTGLDYATGDFVYFLDTDIRIEPGCLTRLAKALIDDKAEMAICSYITETPGKQSSNFFSFTPLGVWTDTRWIAQTAKADIDGANEMLWNRMFKRKLFAGTRFDESNCYAEVALLPEITELCINITSFDRVLVRYTKTDSVRESTANDCLLQKLAAYDRKREIYETAYAKYTWYVDRQIVRHCLKILRLRAVNGTCDALEAGLPDVLDRLVTLSKRRNVCNLKLKWEVFTALKLPGYFSACARRKTKKQ